MIGIVDYGAGNLRSVEKAFDFLGVPTLVVDGADKLDRIDRLVLPGVGAFGRAVRRLDESGMLGPVTGWLRADKPFLGICLGLQLLFEASEESAGERGLALFRGMCRRLEARKVPQIGWNSVRFDAGPALLEGIPGQSFFYFVHSYRAVPNEAGLTIATTDYEDPFPSVVGRGRVWGVQFHPEKSGALGLRVLSNWVRRC